MYFKFTLFACIIFWVSLQCITSALQLREDEAKERMRQMGYTEADIEKGLPISRTFSITNQSTMDKRNFYHNWCQALDLNGKSIEIPESPLKRRMELDWKELEGKTSLQEQIAFWKAYARSERLETKFKSIVFKNACIIYNKAYKEATNDEKPDAADLF